MHPAACPGVVLTLGRMGRCDPILHRLSFKAGRHRGTSPPLPRRPARPPGAHRAPPRLLLRSWQHCARK